MSNRRLKITLQPDVLRWARERAEPGEDELAKKMQAEPERVLEWGAQFKVPWVDAFKVLRYCASLAPVFGWRP